MSVKLPSWRHYRMLSLSFLHRSLLILEFFCSLCLCPPLLLHLYFIIHLQGRTCQSYLWLQVWAETPLCIPSALFPPCLLFLFHSGLSPSLSALHIPFLTLSSTFHTALSLSVSLHLSLTKMSRFLSVCFLCHSVFISHSLGCCPSLYANTVPVLRKEAA